MENSNEGLNAIVQQLVQHIVIEVHSKLVNIVGGAVGQESGPREGHPEGLDAHGFHLLDVLLVLVVKIISHISCIVVRNSAWDLTEIVPQTHAFTIDVPRTFNLVRCCGNSPSKVFSEHLVLASGEVISLGGESSVWKSIGNSSFFRSPNWRESCEPVIINDVDELIVDFIFLHFLGDGVSESTHHS